MSNFEYFKTIKEMPSEERPRERLARLGPEALKDAELIAVILRTGTNRVSVVTLAENLLTEFGNLRRLAQATVEEITSRVKGIGKVKAIELKAALELGKRLASYTKEPSHKIRSPRDVVDLLMTTYKDYETEHFTCIFMNVRNYVIKVLEISKGGLDSAVVSPSEVFRHAVRIGACNVILAHNHPSGDPEPSPADIDISNQLIEAGKILGIQVLDHIIFGDGKYVSLKERGLI
ncbi:MAG: DNA repair protein RadC [Candidatus Hydrogenedentes bacterium]|nr:DNA repair protein RadC [Candidatus Hydrogenedentota bacterium]